MSAGAAPALQAEALSKRFRTGWYRPKVVTALDRLEAWGRTYMADPTVLA